MAVVDYPELPQCDGSDRTETTTVLSDMSESGKIRGRVLYDNPTYELTLVHEAITIDQFDEFEAFWAANYNNEMRVTWAVDMVEYIGIPFQSPRVQHFSHCRVTVTMTLLVKKNG